MHKGPTSKPRGVMEKRVPKSEKYKNISGVLNTGLTASKVKYVSVREYTRRRDEIYYRVTKDMLAALYDEFEGDNERFGGCSAPGDGAGPTIITHAEMAKPHYDRPYLLIDARETGAYDRGRLTQARSWPHTMLLRDKLHPEMYEFKNKEESLIIVYCDDEIRSRETCKILVDRGIENIFLLTGGMVEFATKYPQFVEGEMPNIPISPSKKAGRKYHKSRGSGGLGYADRRQELEAITERVAYGESKTDYTDDIASMSRNTTGHYRSKPLVSDRVARALADHRRERDALRGSPSRGNMTGRRGSSSMYEPVTARDYDDYDDDKEDRDDSSMTTERLRAFNRQQGAPRSARGTPSARGGYSPDERSEAGFSTRSNKSVVESVISRATRHRGLY